MMSTDNDKVIKRFNILCFTGIGLIVLIFVYGTYFKLWGKSNDTIPLIINVGYYLIGFTTVFVGIALTQFILNNYDVLKNQNKRNKSKTTRKK
jgi:hypothetical protein